MHGSSNITLVERIESLKAGVLAALSVALIFGVTLLANQLILAEKSSLVGLPTKSLDLSVWISWSIAAVAGFLFGVTYRYVIRQDQNPHLKSGAVLAFGLVRGLAQVDIGLQTQGNILPFAILGVESILLFAAARLVIDLALAHEWLKPFSSTNH